MPRLVADAIHLRCVWEEGINPPFLCFYTHFAIKTSRKNHHVDASLLSIFTVIIFHLDNPLEVLTRTTVLNGNEKNNITVPQAVKNNPQ